MEYRKSFIKLFEQFCDEVSDGNPGILTDHLLAKFNPLAEEYADDEVWFRVQHYFKTVVIPHKIEVYKAGMDLLDAISSKAKLPPERFRQNLIDHDLSKFSGIEATGYSGWSFAAKTGDKDAFEIAWNHHKHHNPHHPEHWLSVGKGGEVEELEMPEIYVAEMVADWTGAGISYGNLLKDWLPENLHKFKLHHRSRESLRQILYCVGIDTRVEDGRVFAVNAVINP